ncbi:MAG: CopD family protein [Moraxella sp.]|nr:CopD family protein [Moraxella sp.]
MQKLALILHLFGACIWVGGHLYLLIRLMPKFVKHQDIAGFLAFEKSYEPLGMAALAVQVITGLYMAYRIVPNVGMWFNPQLGVLSHLIMAKILWLGLTILTAIHARFWVVTRLQNGTYNERTLGVMGLHVLLICLFAMAFVITGAFFRWG